MKYIYILLLTIYSIVNIATASEISDWRSKQVDSLDQQKQVASKNESQSIGNIYSTQKNASILDTISINNTTFGQIINFVKKGDEKCTIDTWDIINVMNYDIIFDKYMKIITYGQKLKTPPGTAKYYELQNVSCLRIVGCIYQTNTINQLVSNTSITNTQMVDTCTVDIPSLYYRLYQNNEKYFYINKQRIGNEIFMNGNEKDGSFDILSDIKYIGDVMFWGNQSPSSVFVHDLKNLKTENTKFENASKASVTPQPKVGFITKNINQKNSLTLLAQTIWPTPVDNNLFSDPDIKKLLWWEIYGKLLDTNANSQNSFIRSYVNKINISNNKQDITKSETLRNSNNPISNGSGSMSVPDTIDKNRTVTLKECLKSCISAKDAADINFCRNSCLCWQIPKWASENFTWDDNLWVSSVIVLRYCAEPANSIYIYDLKSPKNIDDQKQTIEWLTIILHDFLRTINTKDIMPRSISTENFDFDTMFAKFWKDFDFRVDVTTNQTETKTYNNPPELVTQPDKINSDTQNPANPQIQQSLADTEFYNLMQKWIDKNIIFWQNTQKTTNNLKQTAQELIKRINK